MQLRDNQTAAETYLVGKRDLNSFFVTVCRNGQKPERLEGFRTAEQARAWVRERVQSMTQSTRDESRAHQSL